MYGDKVDFLCSSSFKFKPPTHSVLGKYTAQYYIGVIYLCMWSIAQNDSIFYLVCNFPKRYQKLPKFELGSAYFWTNKNGTFIY